LRYGSREAKWRYKQALIETYEDLDAWWDHVPETVRMFVDGSLVFKSISDLEGYRELVILCRDADESGYGYVYGPRQGGLEDAMRVDEAASDTELRSVVEVIRGVPAGVPVILASDAAELSSYAYRTIYRRTVSKLIRLEAQTLVWLGPVGGWRSGVDGPTYVTLEGYGIDVVAVRRPDPRQTTSYVLSDVHPFVVRLRQVAAEEAAVSDVSAFAAQKVLSKLSGNLTMGNVSMDDLDRIAILLRSADADFPGYTMRLVDRRVIVASTDSRPSRES